MPGHRSSRATRSASVACALLLVAATVAGCAKLVYNRLDSLAAWYVGSLVSLTDAQRADLRAWLTQTLEWHRESELKRYAQFVRELATEEAQPGTRDTYVRAVKRVEGFVEDFTAQTAPQATRLLMELSPAQAEELIVNLEEKSRERSKQNRAAIKAGSWYDERVKDTQRQVKRWTGTITPEQKAIVEELSRPLQPTTTEWLESQRRWRAALRDALNARNSPQLAEQRILQLLREPGTEWTPEYKTKEASNRAQLLQLMAALDASLTTEQRTRLRGEFNELAERLEALTEE